MPTKEELDRELAEFLRREEDEARNGFTKKALHSAMGSLDARFADHEKEDNNRHDISMQAIYGMQARVSALEVESRGHKSDIVELKGGHREAMTSVHDITERSLEDRLSEATEKHKATVDRIWKIAIYVVCAIAGLAIAYVAGRAGIAH